MEHNYLQWLYIARCKFEKSIHYDLEHGLTEFLDLFNKHVHDRKEACNKIVIQELEYVLKIITPPLEHLLDNFALLKIWLHYYSRCATPEAVLYYLEDNGIGVNHPELFIELSRLHLGRKEYVLADEWIRVAEKKFIGNDKIKVIGKQLQDEVVNKLMNMLGSLENLYINDNWDNDEGIQYSDFEHLFFKPILIKKIQQHQSLWRFKKCSKKHHTRKLSDVCVAEYFSDNKLKSFYVDREHRKKYFGERTLLVRELSYRLIQNEHLYQSKRKSIICKDSSKYISKDNFESTFAFWLKRLPQQLSSSKQLSKSCCTKRFKVQEIFNRMLSNTL